MALTVATTHNWQTNLATAADNDSGRRMDRSTGDIPDATNQPANMTSASSVGHGQPTGNQLYHTANPFPPPGSQWTPSPTAAPFYPQFPPFYNAGTPPVAPQAQYFDPNQQLAWAYQQMMLQQAMAQQHHQNQFNHAMAELGRTRANSGPQQNDFFQTQGVALPPPMIPGFPFQSGTPPATPHSGYNGGTQPSQPFRRGPQSHHMPGPRSNTFDNQDWSRINAQNITAPYARPDAAGSSHSVSSSNGSGQASAGGGARQRTTSNNANNSQTPPGSLRGQGSGPARSSTMPQLTTDFERPRQGPHTRNNSSGPPSPGSYSRTPHQRNTSNTSDRTISSVRGQPRSASPTTSSNNAASASSAAPSSSNSSPNVSPISRTNQRTPVKPSPLSQQQTFSEPSATSKKAKRLSKDDSELLPPTTVASALSARQSGLKGRFKRALAFSPPSSVNEHIDTGSSVGHGDASPIPAQGLPEERDGASPVTPVAGESVRSTKPKSRAAALFSGKFNASTDNISLSSTVSSASVMIRKLGSIGKLARRNSLMGITSLFKDKNKDKGESTSASGKKNKKGEKVEASVSHVTAELDRGGSEDESWQNLTPAARVARQHTIKSNEEAAKRLREQAAAASAASAAAAVTNGANGVPTWEKSTTNRRGEGSSRGVSEDGTLLDDRSDGSGEGGYDPQQDADTTTQIPDGTGPEEEDEDEPWAVGLRRSLEKARQPGKAVIKNHVGYVQEHHLDPPNQPFATRVRSNSYQTVSDSMPGPLAHLPSPDPDHIDGLQRSNSAGNTPEKTSFSLPVFSFEFGNIDILPKADDENPTQDASSSSPKTKVNPIDKGLTFSYTHPTANSSAPALSTMFNSSGGGGSSTATTSSLNGMKKSITFAATLSIYDTFSSSVYDRRSEPSTANRLTPALAQRIKEELNSFKMEEMEVHSASRIHTHFFV